MRYIFWIVLLMFCFKNAFAFDLKKLGESLQKDLGGALKELEKVLTKIKELTQYKITLITHKVMIKQKMELMVKLLMGFV